MKIDITTISQERLKELEEQGKKVFNEMLLLYSMTKTSIHTKDLITELSAICENEHELAIVCFTLGYQASILFKEQ